MGQNAFLSRKKYQGKTVFVYRKEPAAWAEVVISTSATRLRIRRAVEKGELRKLASRIYSPNRHSPPEQLIQRHLIEIAAAFFPGAIISDRSALTNGFVAGGALFLTHPGPNRKLELPGVMLRARSGHAPLATDIFLGSSNLFLSSPTRAVVENLAPSRARNSEVSRTLGQEEMEIVLERMLREQGPQQLKKIADGLPDIAAALDSSEYGKQALGLVREFLGTHTHVGKTPILRARQKGRPFDPNRLELFQKLRDELLEKPPQQLIATSELRQKELKFFEAYFSNYIEGTEFEVGQARQIITSGKPPPNRPADGHDILSTFALISDEELISNTPASGTEFLSFLTSTHRELLSGRPEKFPGSWKTVRNQAGGTTFVNPELVEGTLLEGFSIGSSLVNGFARAIYLSFVVAETHPFADGNGRLSRIVMNTELSRKGEQRIIVTTSARDSYISALRALSNNQNPTPLTKVLSWAQSFTHSIDWSSYSDAVKELQTQNVFEEAQDMEGQDLVALLSKSVLPRKNKEFPA